MVKALLFDLDGTLYDRDGAVAELFAAQHRKFEAELGGLPVAHFVERMLELDQHGHADKRTAYGVLVREQGLQDALADRLVQSHREISPHVGELFPDALVTLGALQQRGLALGLISNGRVDTQGAKLRRLGLERFFSALLISEAEGVRKPDRRIFERALQRLGVSADQAWFVGDHPVADVAGAHAAGLTAVWRYVPYWSEPATRAFTIFSLSELLGRLADTAPRAGG